MIKDNAKKDGASLKQHKKHIYAISWGYIIIFSLSIFFALWVYLSSETALRQSGAKQFRHSVNKTLSALINEVKKYEGVLLATAATVSMNEGQMAQADWLKYASKLHIQAHYPNINNIGVAYYLTRSDLKSFLAKQRQQRAEYAAHPPHNKSRFLPIAHLYPLADNLESLGFDFASDQSYMTAIKKARLSGKLAISSPVNLKKASSRKVGFFFYQPLYQRGDLSSNELPQGKFQGVVFLSLLMEKLMPAMPELKNIDLTIFDNKTKLYGHLNVSDFKEGPFAIKEDKNIYGRNWHFYAKAKPSFMASLDNNKPVMHLVSMIAINLLLALIFIFIANKARQILYEVRKIRIENKRSQKKLNALLFNDGLTSLMNRKGFVSHLPKAIKRAHDNNQFAAVFYIDLDDFKKANDSLGHHHGDQLLIAVGDRLREHTRESDFLARLGGDEFALIIENVASEEEVLKAADRLINAFTDNDFFINKVSFSISLSIGIAVYPFAGTTAAALMQHADIAMYRAKELGKNTYVFYSEVLDEKVKRYHKIELAMNKAIMSEEFQLVYQAQTDLNTKQLIGMEVLIRWPSKNLNNPSPMEFIGIAENSRMIVPLGKWVLNKAISDYYYIQEKTGLELEKLSVNISAIQLLDDSFYEEIYLMTERDKNISKFLVLEVTETSLLKNIDKARKVINKVNQLGINFALDDFGTGYSSLSYLKHLPFSILKIDQSFVKDIGVDESDMSIIQAIISLSRKLNLYTVAEGIETRQQYEYLQFHGCNIGQGYFMSKPLPLEAFIQFAEKWTRENH